MFQYCPQCASQNIRFEQGKLFNCPDCNFFYYQNTAAATGCIIVVPDKAEQPLTKDSRLLFISRGKDPAKGKLDMPGGFVDPGEGALEGLYRELKEEIGWAPHVPNGMPLEKIFTLFASFPNVYPYKNIKYNTCDLYFYINAPDLRAEDLHLQKSEITDICFLKPEEINFDDLAFDSTRRAVKTFLDLYY